MNIGMAVYFPVSSLSIFLLRLCSLLSLGFTTVLEHSSDMKENLISAIAAARSSPRSVFHLQDYMLYRFLFVLRQLQLFLDKLISFN